MFADVSEEYARNTAWQCFDLAIRADTPWEIFEHVRQLIQAGDIFLDPLERPFEEITDRFRRMPLRSDVIHRLRNKLKGLVEAMSPRDQWLDPGVGRHLQEVVRSLEQSLTERADDGKPQKMKRAV